MPSASTKPENKAPPEGSDPFKAAVSVVERKVRNLEKRKGKLDQYRLKHEQGETLNEDQKQAIRNYEIVIQNLEFARDLHKQFQDIQADNEKLLKKQLRKEKKEKLERQAAEVKRVHDLLQLQGLLDNMGSDAVRVHFQNGKHGAVVLTEDNLNQLDEFYTLISPSRDNEENYDEQMNQAAEHITNFLDAKDKEVAGSTYKGLKELVDSIQECSYFENYPYKDEDVDVVEEPTVAEPEQPEEAEVEPEPVVEEKTEEVMEAVPEDVPQVPTVEPTTPQAPQPTPQEPSPVVEMNEPGANYEDDSFFSTPTFPAGQRAFQEIVSSVQGTFNFLQESQIGSESPHIDPAVVAVQPMNPGLHKSQTDAMHGTTFQSVAMLGADDQLSQPQPPPQQLTQAPQPQQPDSRMGDPAGQTPTSQTSSLETTYQTTQDYSQNLMTQGLTQSTAHSYADQSSALGHSHSHSHATMDQSVVLGQAISATSDIPPTIALPNQSSLQGVQDQNIIPEGQEKKPFAMNPNAAAFQSMYNPSMSHTQNNSQMAMSSNMHEEKGLNQSDFQNNGFGGNFGGRSNNGGQRGGSRGSSRGGRGGMSNGFSRGGSRGGGGPYNSGRGGSYSSSRGGSRGAYQGYPPRNDYRPEGYQSYSNGYSNGSSFKRGGSSTGASRGNSMRGGAMRGGPPRGGSDRGRGPSRGGFSTRPNPVQVQQTA